MLCSVWKYFPLNHPSLSLRQCIGRPAQGDLSAGSAQGPSRGQDVRALCVIEPPVASSPIITVWHQNNATAQRKGKKERVRQREAANWKMEASASLPWLWLIALVVLICPFAAMVIRNVWHNVTQYCTALRSTGSAPSKVLWYLSCGVLCQPLRYMREQESSVKIWKSGLVPNHYCHTAPCFDIMLAESWGKL